MASIELAGWAKARTSSLSAFSELARAVPTRRRRRVRAAWARRARFYDVRRYWRGAHLPNLQNLPCDGAVAVRTTNGPSCPLAVVDTALLPYMGRHANDDKKA